MKAGLILNFIAPDPGADPGFLERELLGIKVLGVRFADLTNFSYISHEDEMIWSH